VGQKLFPGVGKHCSNTAQYPWKLSWGGLVVVEVEVVDVYPGLLLLHTDLLPPGLHLLPVLLLLAQKWSP
jgi:hypothetical protein